MADISKIKLTPTSEALNIKDQEARQMIANLPVSMQFKGSLGEGGTFTSETFPAASSSNNGWTVKVITDGTYQGVAAQAGDSLTSNGTEWVLFQNPGSGEGTVTNIVTGAELTGGPITSTGTISHSLSGININVGETYTAQGITVNAYGHITDMENMNYAVTYSPAFTGEVNMKNADKVEVPIVDFFSYDYETQRNCALTMETLMQALNLVGQRYVQGHRLVLAPDDTIQGEAFVLTNGDTVEGEAIVLE